MDSDEVRKRKEYAERKVKERHAALRKEAEERRKHTVEHRERVQSQLKREQVLLQKRMQQLNEDEERKKATLAKQHEATSRTAALNKTPVKSFAFGSSTPRTLAYLDNLPRSEQQYDKRLRPIDGPSPVSSSPISTSPTARNHRMPTTPQRAPPATHRPAPTMTSMTSSMYVTSSAPPTRHASKPTKTAPIAKARHQQPPSTSLSLMTQSVYTPTSRPASTSSRLQMGRDVRRSTPVSSRATPSMTNSRRSMDVRKPPMPRKTAVSKPEVKKSAPIVETTPEVEQVDREVREAPESVAAPQETVEAVPEAVETTTEPEIIVEAVPEVPEAVQPQETVEAVEAAPEEPEAVETTPEPESIVEALPEAVQPQETVEAVEAVPEVPEAVEPAVPLIEIDSPAHEPTEPISLDAAERASDSHTGSSLNTTYAEELNNLAEEHEEAERDVVVELNYPMPEEPIAAASAAVNDLVGVFGNDFINENAPMVQPAQHERIVEFDEDTDSGKASPTSSETSSTTDEVTPRGEIEEEPKTVAPRVLPIVRSAEDIAKKEKEAREAEERKMRLAAILAKSRGMASPLTSSVTGVVESSTNVPASNANVVTSPTPPLTSSSAADSEPAKVEENAADRVSNESVGTSDALARVASSLPSLQRLLQRKQGSNPSLQTTESTGGEIY